MLRRIVIAMFVASVLLPVALVLHGGAKAASAHPLGNFTVNRYVRIVLSESGVSLRYIIDMAEIPAFSEIKAIDANSDGSTDAREQAAYLDRQVPEIVSGLDLSGGGANVPLTVVAREMSLAEGQGGLATLRLVLDLKGVAPDGWQEGIDFVFKDTNYSDRLGWQEVVVQGGEGVKLTQSSVPSTDESAELTAYPESRLKSPPVVSEARFRFAAGVTSTAPTPAVDNRATVPTAAGKTGDRFAALIAREKLTPAFVALSLLAAMAWGAAHALGPGHGKTIVAAYLVGSRGTARHALFLGLTVTATHTSTVILLGLTTLYASRFFAAEDLYLWLSVLSGLMVVLMGAFLFTSRLRGLLRRRPVATPAGTAPSSRMRLKTRLTSNPAAHDHAVAHEHQHDGLYHDYGDGHGHSHLPAPGWRGLLALGISGGLLPCPTALVVMLASIALGRTGYGLVLVLAFSVGLAGVLTGIGVILVHARSLLAGSPHLSRRFSSTLTSRWLQAVPLVSAVVIFAAGVLLTGRALTTAL